MNLPGRSCREEHKFWGPGPIGPGRCHKQDLLLLLPDLAQHLCKKAHWGGCIFAQAPHPAVCQCVRAECSLSQGVKQLAVRGLWRGKQVYLMPVSLWMPKQCGGSAEAVRMPSVTSAHPLRIQMSIVNSIAFSSVLLQTLCAMCFDL